LVQKASGHRPKSFPRERLGALSSSSAPSAIGVQYRARAQRSQ
jgi:hypothetical protein